MAVKRIDILTFLAMAKQFPVADVRSPAEFAHAHIPNAFSLPLFTNEERVVVGTTYKQQSRQDAIKTGLDYFGPKMKAIVVEVEAILQQQKTKTILVHCWRGGMRSAAIAWLLDLYGFDVYTLQGGYKTFRTWVLKQFEKPYPLQVLGGYTGSGKTEMLLAMQKKGAVVIDLEGLANHKGSAFGSLGLPPQPSAEMFENMLAIELNEAVEKLAEKQQPFIWVEAESQRIGNINMPHNFFKQMKEAAYLFADISFEERLAFITQWYGKFDKTDLINAVIRIRKRLGGLDTKLTINFLLEDNVQEAFSILLKYYDKYYERSNLAEAKPINKIQMPNINAVNNADMLLNWANKQ